MSGEVFQRIEMKYLLSPAQYAHVKQVIETHLRPDVYGETTIQSLYFDTPDYRLIRASIEGPIYKEKLRLRCYGLSDGDREVFLEMKRKYDGVVYKRRLALAERDVPEVLKGNLPDTQIGRELAYFLSFYPTLEPKMLILYDRSAWLDTTSDLRVTFDRQMRFRRDNLNFHTSLEGEPLLPQEYILMECKASNAFPLWLTRLFGEEKIVKTTFSKYGAAYQKVWQNERPQNIHEGV